MGLWIIAICLIARLCQVSSPCSEFESVQHTPSPPLQPFALPETIWVWCQHAALEPSMLFKEQSRHKLSRLAKASLPESWEVFRQFLDEFDHFDQFVDHQCRTFPNGFGIPAFQTGIAKHHVIYMLGTPNGTSQGYWPNTSTVFYDLTPEPIKLGFIFDQDSGVIRQTEASFTKAVEIQVIVKTLNGMLGCQLSEEIKQGLEQVWQGESKKYYFRLNDVEGVIEWQHNPSVVKTTCPNPAALPSAEQAPATSECKQKLELPQSMRLYIGIWEEDLH